jgi:1,4-dihydroxy-2-naphthoate octaprenyltransferase
MTLVKGLWLGIRPPTLLIGISPVLIGSVYGMKVLNERELIPGWPPGLVMGLTLLLVILMQAAANLVNDVKDAESGLDQTATRLGPQRVVSAGLLSATAARTSYYLMFALVLIICTVLVAYGGWTVLLLGALCCGFAYLYTGGPLPLSHAGAGELVALIFFGPIAVGGSAFLQTRLWLSEAFFLGLGPGLVAAAIMAINNHRDRQVDQQAGKRTLATRLAASQARHLPWWLLVGSFGFFAVDIIWLAASPWWGVSLLGLLAGWSFQTIRPLISTSPEQCNTALKRTSLMALVYALALAGVL